MTKQTQFFNMLLFLFALAMISGFQTAFWTFVTPWETAPSIWVFLLVYISLFRRFPQGLFFAYLSMLILSAFTNMPIGLLLGLNVVIVSLCSFIRSRIFWPTLSYFMLLSLLACVVNELFLWLASWVWESNPTHAFGWKSFFVSALFVPVFSPLVFFLGQKLDQLIPVTQERARET